MADNAVQSVGKGPGNQTRVIVIMGGLIIVALVGVIIALVLNLNSDRGGVQQTEVQLPEQRTILVTEDNVEEVLDELAEEAPLESPGNYEVSMNLTWNFPNGDAESTNAFVENVETNPRPVYFDVYLAETGEVLYQSPVLPVGSHLQRFKLNKALEAGTYDAVIEYHIIDDLQRTLGTLNMAITLIVES